MSAFLAHFDNSCQQTLADTFAVSAYFEDSKTAERRAVSAIINNRPEPTENHQGWILKSSLIGGQKPRQGDVIEYSGTRYVIGAVTEDERYWILELRIAKVVR